MALILSGDTGVPASGMPTGSVIQTVNATYATVQSTTSQTFQPSNLTLTITPQFSNSKIFITGSIPFDVYGGSTNQAAMALYRNSTNLTGNGFSLLYTPSAEVQSNQALNWLDNPATTSATTYTVYFRISPVGSATTRVFIDNYTGSLTAMEIKV